MADELTTKGRGVVVAVVLGGKTVRLEDLPLEVIDRIAKAEDVNWLTVVAQPLSDLILAKRIVDAVAEHLGQEPPTGLSVRQITALFTAVPDDVAEPERTRNTSEPEDDPDPFGSNGNATSTAGSRL